MGNSPELRSLLSQNLRHAKLRWPQHRSHTLLLLLREFTTRYQFSISAGDLVLIDGHWYVTHAGLLRLAQRSSCSSISTDPVMALCDPTKDRWIFKATVFKTPDNNGFAGFGDANPSNVSWRVRGAELRIAETRAVNRALRKAYGIGLCSVEELGESISLENSKNAYPPPESSVPARSNGQPKLRDRLSGLIRQHQLDPQQVRIYATEFCGTTNLREAKREQLEQFYAHLAEWASTDRAGLMCKLNSDAARPEVPA